MADVSGKGMSAALLMASMHSALRSSYLRLARGEVPDPAEILTGHALMVERTCGVRGAVRKYWLAQDFQNPNWWYNVIGVPQTIGDIAILLQAELTPEEREIMVNKIMPRGKIGMTGQNRVWVASITLVRGLLLKDLIETSFRSLYVISASLVALSLLLILAERLGVLTAASSVCLAAGGVGAILALLTGWHRPALAADPGPPLEDVGEGVPPGGHREAERPLRPERGVEVEDGRVGGGGRRR